MTTWLLAWRSEAFGRRGSRTLSLIFGLGAILAPTIIAGLRDPSVGTDTSGYVLKVFTVSSGSGGSIAEVSDYFDGKLEPGYLLAAQIVHVFPSFNAFLTIVGLITFSAAFVATRLFDPSRFSLPFTIYLVMHFNESLNMSRQSVSLAFGMLVAAALVRKKRLLAICGIFLAISFHASAVLLILLPIIYWASEWRNDPNRRRNSPLGLLRDATLVLSIVAPPLIVLRFDLVSSALLGPLGWQARYGAYVTGDGSSPPLPVVVANVTIAIVMILMRKRYRGGQFVAVASLGGAVIYLLTGVSEYLWRIGSYFLSLVPFGATGASFHSTPDQKHALSDQLLQGVLIGTIMGLWVVQIAIWNNHETIPYTSAILGLR